MYTQKPTKEVAVSLYDWSFLEAYILNLVRESYFRPLLPRTQVMYNFDYNNIISEMQTRKIHFIR